VSASEIIKELSKRSEMERRAVLDKLRETKMFGCASKQQVNRLRSLTV
jgi:hypothetical protein